LKAKVVAALADWRDRHARETRAQRSASAEATPFQDPEIERLRQLCEDGKAKQALLEMRKLIVSRIGRLDALAGLQPARMPPIEAVRLLIGRRAIPRTAIEQLEYAVSVSSQSLYKGDVSGKTALAALQAAESGLADVARKLPEGPMFHLKCLAGGAFEFLLRAGGQALLFSERYLTRDAAFNGILSVRKTVELDRIERRTANDGRHYFILVAPNRQIVATSDTFDSTARMNRVIRMVRETVPSAPVIG
jgi:uncharacterized protein YegP (UPF0339 family)